MNYLDKPTDLTEKGEKAYEIIAQFFHENQLTETGGCKAFYSPKEWKEKGEQYGTNSHLVICHDGGDHALAFCHELEAYNLIEALANKLSTEELFVEQCTSWYSAVYSA